MTPIEAQIAEIKNFIIENDALHRVSVMSKIHINTVRDFLYHNRNLRSRNLIAIEKCVHQIKSDGFFIDKRSWRTRYSPRRG